MDADQARDAYAALDAAVTGQMSDVAARSNLLLDPQIEANSLARLMTFDVPGLASDILELRGLGTAIAQDKAVTPEMRSAAEVKRLQVLERASGMRQAFETLYEANANVRAVLQGHSSAAIKRATDLSALLRDRLLRGDNPVPVAEWQAAATQALLERNDVIIVASVSCIYGLGAPVDYGATVLKVRKSGRYRRDAVLRHLVDLQYQRNDATLGRARFRVRGDTLEVQPAGEETILRVEFFGEEIATSDFVHYPNERWFQPGPNDELPDEILDDYTREIYDPEGELRGSHLIDTNSGNVARGIVA